MGFRNPFKRDHMPEHMTSDKSAHSRWRNGSLALMFFSALLAALMTPVIWYTIQNPFSLETWQSVLQFFSLTFQGKLLHIHLLFAQSFGRGPFAVLSGTLIAYGLCMFVAILPGGILALLNPHDDIAYKQGMAAWADEKVLRRMEADKKVGIIGGFVMALGRWPTGKRKGQMVQMIETLSCLCVAPPGTGKTAALIVPTIVNSDSTSFIVNDPKPELWGFTAHYRNTVSHVFMLDWSTTDQPNYIFTFNKNAKPGFWAEFQENTTHYEDYTDSVPRAILTAAHADNSVVSVQIHPGDFDVTIDWLERFASPDIFSYVRPTFYPRFNFLSPRLVPPIGAARDTYLDSIAKTLIDDKKGGDTYFVNKGRAALTGFMHLLVAKVGDGKNYAGVPSNWHDHEPSLPMLADWFTIAQFNATGQGEGTEDGEGVQDPNQQDSNTDKMGEWIRKISSEIKVDPSYPSNHPNNRGKSERGFMELAALVNMADKERSGIVGTMDEALIPFKNAAVKERTSACDFTADDMRGILDPSITKRTKLAQTNKDYLLPDSPQYKALENDKINWKPVTLYVCINQSDAPAFAQITSLLYQVLSRDLLSYAPREYNTKTGATLGHAPVCFALDEFAKLPKISAVLEGPDLGRSKQTMYLICTQALGQIEKIYSKEDMEIIITTTAVKYLLAQNSPEAIDKFQKIVGQTTIRDRNKSGMEGLSKQANPLAANVSEQTSGVNFLRSEDISALPTGKAIVIVQGYSNRPMLLDSALYYEDPILVGRVYPGASRVKPGTVHPRTAGPDLYIPEHLYDARLEETINLRKTSHRRHKGEDDKRTKTAVLVQGVPFDPSPVYLS